MENAGSHHKSFAIYVMLFVHLCKSLAWSLVHEISHPSRYPNAHASKYSGTNDATIERFLQHDPLV